MSKKTRNVRPSFTATRGLYDAFIEHEGEHFATMLDFEAAKEFARILSELESLSQFSGAFIESADGDAARWRIAALVAKHFCGATVPFPAKEPS